jgi:hypothetical protein
MSCEVANSPFPDPGFARPFDVDDTHNRDKVDFAALKDFNYNFGGIDHGCVDPQNLSNAASPASHFGGPALTPDFNPDLYPSNLNVMPASPYFQSVEQPFARKIAPSHLQPQHLHRRSVSEPPDGGLMHHRLPNQDNPMTFTRDGHPLGASRINAPLIKRVKQTRSQPYKRNPRQPPPSSQSRYQLRRSHTQTTHLPPTSVPYGMPPDQPPQQPQQMHHHMPFEPMPREPQYVSSRVCTPAPEAIDPFLEDSPAPMVAPMLAKGNGAFHGYSGNDLPAAENVTIKMGVEELRALITEVVRKAVKEVQAGRSVASAGDSSAQNVGVDGSGQAEKSMGDADMEDKTVVSNEGASELDDVLNGVNSHYTVKE